MEFPRIFKPREKGLHKVFGDLESDIMNVLWDRGKGTVRDIHGILSQDRKIAYTTVMTVMSRLANKDILRKEKFGKGYIYFPQRSRDEILSDMSREVLAGLFADYRKPILSHLVDVFDKLDRDELEELKITIEKVMENHNKGRQK
ncbi:MAG: BlaI/MecI/CopY family transcriptional regulator [Actinomycetota bacterium]